MEDELGTLFADRIIAACSLDAPPSGRIGDLDWLHATHRMPADFWESLFRVLDDGRSAPLKSRPGEGYDPYHDMVVRHLGADRTALQIHDPRLPEGQRWQSFSFDDLHARCTLRAASWAAQGVEPGAPVCIVLPFGVECAISLLTALRIGALVSLLEPGGPALLGRRLEALAPRHIATDAFYRPLLGPFADLSLEPAPSSPLFGALSRWYRPGEPCAALFSPLRRPPHLPVPLRCDELYLGALRDGAMTFALRPGDRLAAPGFDTLQHQPALLFAALLAGATYVHIEVDEALRDPRLLDTFPLRSLGLGARVCEHLSRTRAIARPQWSHVFRNPEEPTDWESWRELIDALGLHETAMSNVVIEAAAGGSLLASPRRPGKAHLGALMNVVPAAGRPWRLLDFTGSGQPAVGDVGVFAPLTTLDAGEADPIDLHVVLGRRHGGEFLYGGATQPRRSGRVYPVDEVLAALDDCPFLHGASLVAVPSGGPTLAHRFVLLGFTGDEPTASFEALRAARVDELQRVLSTRLTPEFLPDAIELYPCFPRRVDGEIDHGWCHLQFHGGALHARVRTPVFQRLTALRGALGRA